MQCIKEVTTNTSVKYHLSQSFEKHHLAVYAPPISLYSWFHQLPTTINILNMFKTRCLQDDDAHLSIVDTLSCSFRLNMWNSLDVSADQSSSGQIPVSTSACAAGGLRTNHWRLGIIIIIIINNLSRINIGSVFETTSSSTHYLSVWRLILCRMAPTESRCCRSFAGLRPSQPGSLWMDVRFASSHWSLTRLGVHIQWSWYLEANVPINYGVTMGIYIQWHPVVVYQQISYISLSTAPVPTSLRGPLRNSHGSNCRPWPSRLQWLDRFLDKNHRVQPHVVWKIMENCRNHLQLVIVRDFPFLDCKVL